MIVRHGLAVGLSLALGCGRKADPAVLAVDVTGCQPVRHGSVVSASLRADAPEFPDGRRYRCLVFAGAASHRVQLTVFAEGFEPGLYLLEPVGSRHRLLAQEEASADHAVARASVILPRTSPYAAVVTADAGRSGTFLLSVQDQP